MEFLSQNIEARLNAKLAARGDKINDTWQMQSPIVMQLGNVISTVPRVFKGDPVPPNVPFTMVPPIVSPLTNQIQLSNIAIDVRGSFAPTITDAGFTYIAGTDSVTIYYDGTNGSKRVKQRRRSGYDETLPPGFITITGLTPSAVGAAEGPSYDLIPFYIPGSCAVSWVQGVTGTPAFCWPSGTATPDDINKASIRGREPIAGTVISIQLQPVPVPPPPPDTPPPVDPGTPSGNTGVNGTLTTVVDYPGQNAAENISFNASAHASDSSGKAISGWEAYVDGTKIFNYSGAANPSVTFPINTNPGTHTLITKAYNTAGTHADVTTPFSTSDLGTGGAPQPPPPTPDPTPTVPPRTPTGCVMLGTVIETLGPSPWHQEQMPQNEWVRIFTDRGRELIGTPDHPVFTARAGRTELRDCRKGDYVVCNEGEERVMEVKAFNRPGVKVRVHMDWGHLFWAGGVLSHNVKIGGL
jgi:hypothetical protein